MRTSTIIKVKIIGGFNRLGPNDAYDVCPPLGFMSIFSKMLARMHHIGGEQSQPLRMPTARTSGADCYKIVLLV